MKIFLTGSINSGKSHMITSLQKELQFPVCGFLTLPFYKNGKREGFYMHSLVPVENNDIPFAIQQVNNCKVIPNIFNVFGFTVLRESLKYSNHVMILDEIGRLEKEEMIFLEQLKEVIEKHRFIIGVLKKTTLQYIQEIQNRKDVIVYDLDKESYEDVYKIIKERIIKEYEKIS